MNREDIILKSLMSNQHYTNFVIPFIKAEYFTDRVDKILFRSIYDYIAKYKTCPTNEAIKIDFDNNTKLSENDIKSLNKKLDDISKIEINQKNEWLIDISEKFCRDKAIYNALYKSIELTEKKDGKVGSIPDILSKALAVSFDDKVGLDYIESSDLRYDYYTQPVHKIPFDIDYLNTVTEGGVPKKTLNVILAGTNVGKTLIKCHLASSYMMQGQNVLYITCEMSEEEILKRVDANLLDVEIGKLNKLTKPEYIKKFGDVKKKILGKLIVKEYPTSTANVTHFSALLEELHLKKEFVPDVVFVDYLNICSSSRMKGNNSDTYNYIKSISEELRGMAVEKNIVLWTSTQTNRAGFGNTDVDLTNVSESFSLPSISDFFIAAIRTEDLDELDQIMIKQLKSRYSDITSHLRFFLGINRAKQRLYDLNTQDNQIQKSLPNTTTAFTEKDTEVITKLKNDSKRNFTFDGIKL